MSFLLMLSSLILRDSVCLICVSVCCLQLPDYHEIITNPMDFSTLRKKLDSGAYATLEQFEVCLCTPLFGSSPLLDGFHAFDSYRKFCFLASSF